jgi:uncharacterized DUF497 family protein
MTFEWDEDKNRLNIKKHGISFQEAVSVFADDDKIEYYDKTHSSIAEERYIVIGRMKEMLVLFVSYTERLDVIRIISARKAKKQEEKEYYDSYNDA